MPKQVGSCECCGAALYDYGLFEKIVPGKPIYHRAPPSIERSFYSKAVDGLWLCGDCHSLYEEMVLGWLKKKRKRILSRLKALKED